MNLIKMRRNLGRNVPDAVWKDFDRRNFTGETDREFIAWREWFRQMMKYKHGYAGAIIDVCISDMISSDKVRIQLVYRPKSPFDRGYFTKGEIKEMLGYASRETGPDVSSR